MDTTPKPTYLATKYVFIDTEALRQLQFDWDGRTLSKLAEFAKAGDLQLITTDVTKHEVLSNLREMALDAATAVEKHNVTLRMLGGAALLEMVRSTEAALKVLEARFEQFLQDTKTIEIPMAADLSAVLKDYFARQPPFGERKKKAEFPDAIVVGTLRSWCKNSRNAVYVVSGDQDLKACCSDAGPLYYSPSVADVISQATVSETLREALDGAISKSEALNEIISEKIKDFSVGTRDGWRFSRRINVEKAKIQRIDDISIHYVNIIDRRDGLFVCEIELEAELVVDVDIQVEGEMFSYEEYTPSFRHSDEVSFYKSFLGEVEVRFDPAHPEDIEFESVHVSGGHVELDADKLEDRFLRFRWSG